MLTGTDALTEYKHFTGLKSCLKFLEFRDTMKKKKRTRKIHPFRVEAKRVQFRRLKIPGLANARDSYRFQ